MTTTKKNLSRPLAEGSQKAAQSSELATTSICMEPVLLEVSRIKAKKVDHTSLSGLLSKLSSRDMVAHGWLDESGRPTAKAEAEMRKKRESDKRKEQGVAA